MSQDSSQEIALEELDNVSGGQALVRTPYPRTGAVRDAIRVMKSDGSSGFELGGASYNLKNASFEKPHHWLPGGVSINTRLDTMLGRFARPVRTIPES